jgi:hypothetical protein
MGLSHLPRKLSEQQFRAACLIWEDRCRLIAAGKVQRWDVVKWCVTVNLLIAGAAAGALMDYRGWIFAISAVLTLVSLFLVIHYNLRIGKSRTDSENQFGFFTKHDLDIYKLGLSNRYSKKKFFYDRQEMVAFPLIILLSMAPTGLVCWPVAGPVVLQLVGVALIVLP